MRPVPARALADVVLAVHAGLEVVGVVMVAVPDGLALHDRVLPFFCWEGCRPPGRFVVLDPLPGPVPTLALPLGQYLRVTAVDPGLSLVQLDPAGLLARPPELAPAEQAGLDFPVVHLTVALAVRPHVVVVGQVRGAVLNVDLLFRVLFHGYILL